jgi:amino acid transporter
LSGVADNSLYPMLFIDTFVSLVHGEGEKTVLDNGLPRMATTVVIAVLLTYFNYRGLDVVGRATIIISVLTVLPFVVFCLVGAAQVDIANWAVTPEGGLRGIDWRRFLNSFFWNINYWYGSHYTIFNKNVVH